MGIVVLLALPVSAQVGTPIEETWESGDFTAMSWERPDAQYRWEITSEGAHSGRYCARSGNYYTLNTESVLQLAVYLTDTGTLSYYRKVFSAEGSGGFLFWLDGELRDLIARGGLPAEGAGTLLPLPYRPGRHRQGLL